MEAINLADLYDLAPLEWAPIEARLDEGLPQAPGTGGPNRHTCWLATINADGSPHVTGLGALWVDGAFWFQTGATPAQGQEPRPRPTLALSASPPQEFDLVVEGDGPQGHRPTPWSPTWRCAGSADGWPARVDDTGTAITAEYSAPSAGPPPWAVYQADATARHGARDRRAGWRDPLEIRPVNEVSAHLDQVADVTPSSGGCEDCLRIGSRWLHLRVCMSCVHVGCCDSSPNRHASAHFRSEHHPIIQAYEPDEDWWYCYVEDLVFLVEDALRSRTPEREHSGDRLA